MEDLEAEVLLAVLGEQERFETGKWNTEWTLRSRTSYMVGKAHDALQSTPLREKFDLERHFKLKFDRVMKRLVQSGFVRFRSIRGHDKQFTNHMGGYKKHRRKGRDIVLTELGRQTAEAIRGKVRTAQPAPTVQATETQRPKHTVETTKPEAKPAEAGFYDYTITFGED